MRSKSVEQVLNTIPANLLEAGDLPWAPIVDGKLIPQQPADAIAAGLLNKVPIINGSNRDEGTLFTAFSKPLSAEQYRQAVHAQSGKYASTVLAAYPAASYVTPAQAGAAALGDFLFSCRILKTTELLAESAPVFQYEFDDPGAARGSYPEPSFPLGAYHGSEIQYVFGNLKDDTATDAQHRLSDAIIDYWTAFMSTGDPAGAPNWTRFDAANPKVLLLKPDGIGYESDFPKIHHCELWNSMQAASPDPHK